MTLDPMAPEVLALSVLPEWMTEAVRQRLDRMGEPRDGDIAQALGLAVPPKPAKRTSPPAKFDPARLRSPGPCGCSPKAAARKGTTSAPKKICVSPGAGTAPDRTPRSKPVAPSATGNAAPNTRNNT